MKEIKDKILNFLLPVGSKRRKIFQYTYRLLKNKENRIELKEKIKENGFKKGLRYSFYKLVIPDSREAQENQYSNWINNNKLTKEDIEKQKNTQFEYSPLISIITPLYNTPKEFFIDYLESIQKQTYQNWEICLVDASKEKLEYIEDLIKQDEKIKYKKLEVNNGISENSNKAIEMARGEFIALIDHDDMISQNALFEIVSSLNENKETDFIYTDEDKFEGNLENRYFPFFKPDFSPDFLRSNNYICHLSVIRKELVEKVGYFKKEFDGAQDYDLFLKISEQTKNIVHIPKVLYHWRIHNLSTAQNMETKMYAIEAGKKAIEEHCKRLNLHAEVYEEKPLGLYRVKYELNEKPLISIIIPNKDSIKYLKKAIKSVLKSTYINYEIIIVENNSEKAKTFKYYDIIQKNPKIKVIKYEEKGFNYSKINNFAIKQAKGEYIVLLNNDIKIITPNWLEEMLSLCQRDEVGIVGAKLLYYDKTIQHAGVVIGMGGIAGHVNRTIPEKEPGYYGRTKVINNYSAVTAACLMTKKELYEKVEGLDEKFAVAFNDVDFCMKIRKLNKLIIYTPYAKLYHYESKSRGYEDTPEKKKRFEGEIALFKQKWGKELEEGDPYFNPNLDLFSEQCEIKGK